MRVCTTSLRETNSSAQRSQTARPSRLVNGFFSLSLNRDERPAAGRMTAKFAMTGLPSERGGRRADGVSLRLSYGATGPCRQPEPHALGTLTGALEFRLDLGKSAVGLAENGVDRSRLLGQCPEALAARFEVLAQTRADRFAERALFADAFLMI